MIYIVLFMVYVLYLVPQHFRLDCGSLLILMPWVMVTTHVLRHGSLMAVGVLVVAPVLISWMLPEALKCRTT